MTESQKKRNWTENLFSAAAVVFAPGQKNRLNKITWACCLFLKKLALRQNHRSLPLPSFQISKNCFEMGLAGERSHLRFAA